ncbi:MAG: hypothetical protein QW625_03600 [Candidatus Nanoarchaeia archaeon]
MKIFNYSKGQVWSLDFITSLIIFLFAFLVVFFIFSYLNAQSAQQAFFNDIESLSLSISDILVRTKGIPEDWNETNVIAIGLASEENALNETKISYFFSMANSDYERTKAILTGGYDFYFSLTDINGTSYGSIGSKENVSFVVPIERYCLYKNRVVKLEFAIVK